MDYNRPGVYLEEIALLPPSVVGVSTAVPAFIGYTEKGPVGKSVKIATMVDFISIFGGPLKMEYSVNVAQDESDYVITSFELKTIKKCYLYHSVRAFFQLGKGPCYIVSTGYYDGLDTYPVDDPSEYKRFEYALNALENEDEPTLLLFPDATAFTNEIDYYALCNQALGQCEKLKNRFVILDVIQKNSKEAESAADVSMNAFREGIGMQPISKLKYGAAYFPFIDTIFQYEYDESLTMVQVGSTSVETDVEGLRISYLKRDNRVPGVEIINSKPSLYFEKDNDKWLIKIKGLGDGCASKDLISVLPDSCVGYSIGAEGSEEETIGAETTFIKDDKYNFISGLKGIRIQANENNKGLPKVAFCEGNNLDFTIIADENKLIIYLPSESPKTAEEVLSAWNAKISGEPEFDALSFTFSKLGDGSGEIKLSDGPPRRGVAFEGENVVNEQRESIFLLVYYGDLLIDAIKPIRFDFVVKNISSGATPSLAIIGLGQDGTSSDEIADAAIDFDIYPFRIEKLPIDNETPDSSLSSGSQSLANLQDTRTGLYNLIKRRLEGERVTMLPPSGAIAGLFAAVDGTRGVWKAPANVSLIGVAGPSLRITDADHDNLNVNADTGKSINAIRNYTGKGTLVMGARTLAGNDNEWRYINVRRLFIMVETAVKKATEAFIFEPNTITTWLKVKGMIESYLYGLWQNGALAGSKPEQAYFVNVGLGKTMSQDDILNGRMIVDVGLAAVRPAEFIILRFSHKMQEA